MEHSGARNGAHWRPIQLRASRLKHVKVFSFSARPHSPAGLFIVGGPLKNGLKRVWRRRTTTIDRVERLRMVVSRASLTLRASRLKHVKLFGFSAIPLPLPDFLLWGGPLKNCLKRVWRILFMGGSPHEEGTGGSVSHPRCPWAHGFHDG